MHADYYPYREDNPSTEQTGQAEVEVDRPCKLIQRAGEVLYVPRHWTHQVRSTKLPSLTAIAMIQTKYICAVILLFRV